ncbi:MAG: cellulase family glycosylhydrolase [Chloroflexia bacterium]
MIRRSRRSVVRVVLLVIALGLLLPPAILPILPVAAAGRAEGTPLPQSTLLGIAAHAWWLDPYQDQMLAAFKDLNVQVVRISIDWKRVEATKGQYDWSLYDRTLIPLAERRIAIVGDLSSFPAWTSTDPECAVPFSEPQHCLPRPEVITDWERFCAAAAARYPFIERWEIWNEPELWYGMKPQDHYLAYVRSAHRAIHANNARARVAITSLIGWSWLRELYAQSPANDRPWEAIAYHPYPIPGGINDNDPDHPIDTDRIEELRRRMDENGDQAKPIWITEFGFSKPPADQARRLMNTLSWFAARPYIELACLHMLHDWAGDDPSPAGYGLMSADPRPTEENPQPTRFTPKEPFYSTFKQYPRSAPPLPPDGPGQRSFPQTGQTIAGGFLAAWQERGGLPIFGYPLTDVFWERLENGHWYRVQYFERARFEYHPENPAPYDILLGQFGRALHPADAPVAAEPGARYFAETGHNLSGGFRTYWEGRGGLAQFGFPISEVFTETLEDGKSYRVQYFERARFEYHPENPAPYDILLGQFGRRILASRTP